MAILKLARTPREIIDPGLRVTAAWRSLRSFNASSTTNSPWRPRWSRGSSRASLQLLGPSKEAAAGGGERIHYADIVSALQRNVPAFEKTFIDSLRRKVAEDLDEQRASTEAAGARGDGMGLELMDESRVEVDIEISRAMQLIDTTADWELRELQTFTSTLVGQEHVSAESNPFRPLVYATALWEATCAIVASQIQRAISCARLPASPPACSRTPPRRRRLGSKRKASSRACTVPSCCRRARASAVRSRSRRAKVP